MQEWYTAGLLDRGQEKNSKKNEEQVTPGPNFGWQMEERRWLRKYRVGVDLAGGALHSRYAELRMPTGVEWQHLSKG